MVESADNPLGSRVLAVSAKRKGAKGGGGKRSGKAGRATGGGKSAAARPAPVLDPALDAVMRQATALHGQDHGAEAERLYLQVLEKQPDHYIALNNLGALKDSSHPGDGETLFRRAIDIHPGYADGWNNLARSLMRRGQATEGIACLERAVLLRPDYPMAWANLVEACEMIGDTDRVAAVLERAAGAVAPEALTAGVDLAEKLMKAGRTAESLRIVDQLIARLPPNARLIERRADMLVDLQRWDEAAEAYAVALSLAPDNAAVRRNQVVALIKAGRTDEAENAARDLNQRSPDDAEGWNLLGTAAYELGRNDAAIGHFNQALQREPGNVVYIFNRGLAAYAAGDMPAAIEDFSAVLEQNPDYAAAINNLGSALDKSGRHDEAAAVLERAIAKMPDDLLLLNTLGLTYTRLGRFDEAEALLRHAVALKEDFVEAWSNLGKVFMDSRDYGKAEVIFRRAIDANPRYVIGRYNLGLALNQAGRFEEALEVMRAARQLDPDFAPLSHNLGLMELTQGNFAAGFEAYRWRHARQELEFAGPGWKPRDVPLPENFGGKWAYLVGEQGIGDELFFLRCLPELKRRGARVVYRPTKKKFVPIIKRIEGLDEVIEPDQEVESGFAYQCLVGDLPYVCGVRTAADVPPAAHLIPDPDRVARFYLEWLEQFPPPYIGINWRAGTEAGTGPGEQKKGEIHYQKLFKEITLADLVDMFRGLKATLVVLQRNPKPDEIAYLSANLECPLLDCSDLNDDLPEMLALLDLLDDMVGVSNTNYHMRAGLGKGGRVLVPRIPDFRWMASGDSSPWFPGMKIYRETFADGWGPALAALRGDLEVLAAPLDALHGKPT